MRQGQREEILREARRVEAALAAPANGAEGEPVHGRQRHEHDRSTDSGQDRRSALRLATLCRRRRSAS